MPELPEVETVVRTLRPWLVGRSVGGFEVLWARTVDPQSPDEIARILKGRRVHDVYRRGKYIVLVFDDELRLAIHLRMTGELRFIAPDDAPPDPEREQYLRARIQFEDESELLFYDVRKFGRIRLYTPEAWESLDGALGIEPLSDEFTPEKLFHLLGSRRRQIKPLLLDQTVVAGLGNIYVDEALFRAGVHPLARSDSLSLDDATRLHAATVQVLSQAVENRGTTFRDYRTGAGDPGDNLPSLLVYGSREGAPCPRCGTGLRRLIIGQRGTVFCPRCQPGPGLDQVE